MPHVTFELPDVAHQANRQFDDALRMKINRGGSAVPDDNRAAGRHGPVAEEAVDGFGVRAYFMECYNSHDSIGSSSSLCPSFARRVLALRGFVALVWSFRKRSKQLRPDRPPAGIARDGLR